MESTTTVVTHRVSVIQTLGSVALILLLSVLIITISLIAMPLTIKIEVVRRHPLLFGILAALVMMSLFTLIIILSDALLNFQFFSSKNYILFSIAFLLSAVYSGTYFSVLWEKRTQ